MRVCECLRQEGHWVDQLIRSIFICCWMLLLLLNSCKLLLFSIIMCRLLQFGLNHRKEYKSNDDNFAVDGVL